MLKHNLTWESAAWEDYLFWQETDKKIVKKINALIQAIDRDPFDGIGKPEPLQHELKGFWSRRITQEHRIIYTVKTTHLIIVSCRYHYE